VEFSGKHSFTLHPSLDPYRQIHRQRNTLILVGLATLTGSSRLILVGLATLTSSSRLILVGLTTLTGSSRLRFPLPGVSYRQKLVNFLMYRKHTFCMYSCACLRQCTKMEFSAVAISAIFVLIGNEFELGENKFERERETIIFSIQQHIP
jgi:hypothetical protein